MAGKGSPRKWYVSKSSGTTAAKQPDSFDASLTRQFHPLSGNTVAAKRHTSSAYSQKDGLFT